MVYCLVRSDITESEDLRSKDGHSRILDTLAHYNLKHDLSASSFKDRIKIILGDITAPQFALTDSEYESLSAEIDMVINCATYRNPSEKYETDTKTWSTNIGGLLNILRFCTFGKRLKSLFHASTLEFAETLCEIGHFTQD